MQKTIFVDIDQTISTGHVCQDLEKSKQFYRDLGVDLPEVESWQALFQVPEVARRHEVLPGAQEGIRQLATLGEVLYATARKEDVQQITLDWLQEHGFPSADQVVFVAGVSEKLLAIAAFPGPLVLVDDRWRQLHEIIAQYGERHRIIAGLRERLTLVAFGASERDMPEHTVVPVVPLPNWSVVAELRYFDPFVHNIASQARRDEL